MKEIIEIMMNPGAVLVDGKLEASAEIVVVFSEPHYRLQTGGEVLKEHHTGANRYAMSPKRMRQFAAGLLGAAETLEREIQQALEVSKA